MENVKKEKPILPINRDQLITNGDLFDFKSQLLFEIKTMFKEFTGHTDGDWQFLTGDQMPDDIRLVALEQIVLRTKH